MPASTSPDPTTRVTLRVQTDNPAAEVILLDHQLQLAARGVGWLVTQQVPGVYKIRVRLGRESVDKLVLLSGDTTESINAPVFASPAPLGRSALTHEYHIAAAETYSAQPTVILGDGASIFVLVRYFTQPGSRRAAQENPARDLSLRAVDGNVLVDFASASVTGAPPDAWAACHVRLAPGAYVLQCETPQGPLARILIASPGWQTQVFLIRSQAPMDPAGQTGAAAPTGIFDMGTVLMSSGPFRSGSTDLRLTELARIALADERPIMGGELRDLLVEKFTNPMQGIFGAHLMLLARDRSEAPVRPDAANRAAIPDPESRFDQGLFDFVVSNLRSLVGPTHPDVEALSLQARNPLRTKSVFTVPPMLRRSWSLIVAASNDRPDILDPALGERVLARTVGAPFLAWRVMSDTVRAEIHASVKEAVDSRNKMRDAKRRAAPGRDAALSGLAPAAPAPPTPPGDDFRRRLSVDLEMPRGAVDRLLGGQ